MTKVDKIEKEEEEEKKKKKKTKASKKKSSKRKYLKYSEKSLRDALKAVDRGMSVRGASSKFRVPFSTIRCKSKGLFPLGKRSGPPSALSRDEEDRLARWVESAGGRGFRLTTNSILDSVKLLVKQSDRKTSFNDDRPGKRWYRHFLKRHAELAGKICQNKRQKQAPATEKALREWFEEVASSRELGPKRLLDVEPSRIFSCNELAFFLNPNDDTLILNKTLGLYNLNEPNNQECLVAMLAGNAAGQILPPMAMFSEQEVPKDVLGKLPRGWRVGRSDGGWMTGVSFFEYASEVFYPWCCENGVQFPVVLYLAEHCPYYTMALRDFCDSRQIELVPLFTNSLRINPMNVALFWPLKKTWQEVLLNWKAIHGDRAMKKASFAPILQVVLESIDIATFLKNGFSSCGLSPFSADVINYTKLLDFGQIIHFKTFYLHNLTVNGESDSKKTSKAKR